jgi:hypothetical protein
MQINAIYRSGRGRASPGLWVALTKIMNIMNQKSVVVVGGGEGETINFVFDKYIAVPTYL